MSILVTVGSILGVGLWAATISAPANADQAQKPVPIWPGVAPGEKGDIPEEKDTTAHNAQGKPVDGIIRLGNVSAPTITVFSPPAASRNGTAIIVCPGGGYSILAYDLEGTEVCARLNEVGVTAILLKYRVPARKGLEKHTAALQDAQRAISLVRSKAGELGIKPDRIGILGFSAGGHLSAAASTGYETRTYSAIDDVDKVSCRPDFTVLVYPAYLTQDNDRTKLAPELKVTANTPPAFMAMTQDDPIHVENVFAYGLALKNAGVPFEMHVYPKGGHGYGLRPTENMVSHWPQRLDGWMESRGLIAKRQ